MKSPARWGAGGGGGGADHREESRLRTPLFNLRAPLRTSLVGEL